MNARPLVAGAVLLVACYHRREVARADWPVLDRNRGVTVQTLDGSSRKFAEFVFTTAGLAGWNRSGTYAGVRADSTLIPLDSIAAVRVTRLNTAGTAMLLAAATTATFILLAEQESEVRPTPVPRPASCPFIYSFTGDRYVFDSETYAGAIARGMERTDVDNLDSLRAVGGSYRLRLTNERLETHYTDELALLIADHPKGTRAVPDAEGTVHLARAYRRALRVSEFSGDTTPSRAGWELAFVRPPSDTAALVLQLRNTPVAPFVVHRVLSLLGSDVYRWYSAVRNDRLTRAIVRGWIDNEGALDVQVRAGDAWRAVARVPDVGPAISKTQVVVLDMRGVRGDTVRVRLESSPGLWMLEQAQLATYAGRAATRELRPVRATDEHGEDVTTWLAARDTRYLITGRGSDVAIEFEAPPVAPGAARSIFARTTGHYYVHTDDRAEPRKDMVARLMADRKFSQDYFAAAWLSDSAASQPIPLQSTGPASRRP